MEKPDGTVRQVIYPIVGEGTMRDLIAEYKAAGPTYRRTVQTTLKASYTNHYRRGLIRLIQRHRIFRTRGHTRRGHTRRGRTREGSS